MALAISEDVDAGQWDDWLAGLDGHPLQSAIWGRARVANEPQYEQRFAILDGEFPVLLARVERRFKWGYGPIAWVPFGPAGGNSSAHKLLASGLRRAGYRMVISQPAGAGGDELGVPVAAPAATLQIALDSPLDALWRALDKQWRYGVRRAQRDGVMIKTSCDAGDISWFQGLLRETAIRKGFTCTAQVRTIETLLASAHGAPVHARLFLATAGECRLAGALVLVSGKRAIYTWGATERDAKFPGAGEALQWRVIDWAKSAGLTIYDLGGIDAAGNPGVYAFKKKMGGREYYYPPLRALGLTVASRLAAGILHKVRSAHAH